MDICASTPWNTSGWQEGISFKTNFKNVLFSISNVTVTVGTEVPERLTTEAVCMIIVIIIFVVISTLGSLITAYEVCCENYIKEKKANNVEENKTDSNNQVEQKRSNSSPRCNGKSVWVEDIKSFLTCFCVVKNGKKILQPDSSKEQFDCIHGIRSLSSIWLIMVHTGMFYMFTIKNMESVKPWITSWTSQFMLNSMFAVDGFFVMSGFLNGYTFSKDYTKNNGEISLLYFYIKRLIRLTPVYMIVLGVHTALISSTCASVEESCSELHSACKEGWWWNLLYVNNFQTSLKQCMVWSWYLALEMQFYFVSPIFLILLLRKPTVGYIFTSLCISLSCFAGFIVTKHCGLVDGTTRMSFHTQDLGAFLYKASVYFEKVYELPHTRIDSYLVGILLGYYVYIKRKDGKDTSLRNVTLFCGWIGSIVLMLATLLVMHKRKESILENAVYNGVKNLNFSIGFAWLIYVCVTGQAGRLNSVLSFKAFIPISKLSFCSYLIHMVLVLKFYHTGVDVEKFSALSVIYLYLWVHFWTLVFSIPASLLFEIPMGNLLDFFRKRNSSQKVNH